MAWSSNWQQMPGLISYPGFSPEQLMLQQQNWQQWQTYYEQYAQWQAQYGEQYQREISKLHQQPPLPPDGPQPPLPGSTNQPPPPPPPPSNPDTQAPPPPPAQTTASASISAPPRPNPVPPPPPPTNQAPQQQNRQQFNNNNGNNFNRKPPFNNNRNFHQNNNRQNNNQRNFNNQGGNNNNNRGGFNRQNNRGGRFNNQQQFNNQNFQQNSQFNQQQFSDNQQFPEQHNNYQGDQQNQQGPPQALMQQNDQNTDSQQQYDMEDPDEKMFDEHFKKWETEFLNWKKENQNHPDKESYFEYEKKFEEVRQKLLERRDQMRQRKRMELLTKSGPPPMVPPPNLECSLLNDPAYDPSNENTTEEVHKLESPQQSHIPVENIEGLFSKDTSGIPGLDLVEDGENKMENSEDVIDLDDEVEGPPEESRNDERNSSSENMKQTPEKKSRWSADKAPPLVDKKSIAKYGAFIPPQNKLPDQSPSPSKSADLSKNININDLLQNPNILNLLSKVKGAQESPQPALNVQIPQNLTPFLNNPPFISPTPPFMDQDDRIMPTGNSNMRLWNNMSQPPGPNFGMNNPRFQNNNNSNMSNFPPFRNNNNNNNNFRNPFNMNMNRPKVEVDFMNFVRKEPPPHQLQNDPWSMNNMNRMNEHFEQEDEYFKPVKVIDYSNQTPTKNEPDILLPAKVVDYGHKSANLDNNSFGRNDSFNYGGPYSRNQEHNMWGREMDNWTPRGGSNRGRKRNRQNRIQERRKDNIENKNNANKLQVPEKDNARVSPKKQRMVNEEFLEGISDDEMNCDDKDDLDKGLENIDDDDNFSLPSVEDVPIYRKDSSPTESERNDPNLISINDILFNPGRKTRPAKIIIVLRGLPGSGKSHAAKLIKDKEVEMGGSAPRILSIDDYFTTETDETVPCPETGKSINKRTLSYEYDKSMESQYMQYLVKAFRKNVTDGYFDFIIVDAVNEKWQMVNDFVSFGRANGFTPYVCPLNEDPEICCSRNIHNRTEEEIIEIYDNCEPCPEGELKLDVRSLLESDTIPEIDMEEISNDELDAEEDKGEKEGQTGTEQTEDNGEEGQEAVKGEGDSEGDEEPGPEFGLFKSKWESDPTDEKLAKLDGTSKPLRHATIEDFLQGDEFLTAFNEKPLEPGKKRVRWADIEEKKAQEKMRAIGFVVGQTDWNRMMDPTDGASALTKTKYIERVKKDPK